MSHFDRFETRAPRSREREQLRALRGILAEARPRTPALREQIKGIDIATLKTYADLRHVPLVRRADLRRAQHTAPPFGGFVAVRPSALRRIVLAAEGDCIPEGQAKDWWSSGRALFAAGLRKGDVAINCFSRHSAVFAYMVECGSLAVGSVVIPTGAEDTERQLAAIDRLKPTTFCGTIACLEAILTRAARLNRDVSPIRAAVVADTDVAAGLREDFALRGIAMRRIYSSEHAGVIAYETEAPDGTLVEGMVVNEGVIVEIVRPGTGDPVAAGEVGELVVTRLNRDYPLLRFATGDLSALVPGPSPCGRTNVRIQPRTGRADQTATVMDRSISARQLGDVARRHPELGRLRLVVTRACGQDVVTLLAEGRVEGSAHVTQIAATLQTAVQLPCRVKVVAPGSLPNDGIVIADDRQVR